jgi:hypothetical protein
MLLRVKRSAGVWVCLYRAMPEAFVHTSFGGPRRRALLGLGPAMVSASVGCCVLPGAIQSLVGPRPLMACPVCVLPGAGVPLVALRDVVRVREQ